MDYNQNEDAWRVGSTAKTPWHITTTDSTKIVDPPWTADQINAIIKGKSIVEADTVKVKGKDGKVREFNAEVLDKLLLLLRTIESLPDDDPLKMAILTQDAFEKIRGDDEA